MESVKKIKLFDVKIRVYLFKSNEYLDMSVFVDDSVLDVKVKIFQQLDENSTLKNKLKIKYFLVDAWEMRMVEDEDDFAPNMDFAPLDDKLNLIKSGQRVLVYPILIIGYSRKEIL